MSYYQSSANNSSRYASPANYARASPQQQQYGSQTVGRRGGIPHSRPVHYSDSEEYSSDSDSDSDSESDDEDEAPSYQRRGAVHHRPSTSSYSSSSSRQPSHHPASSAYHASYQHQPQYTSQHQSAPVQRSSSPRGYMMQSNTTARMGLNMLTQAPSSQDPVASSSEDRRRPLPIPSQYASSGSRHGSNASAATSGGWGSVSGSVSSASGRSGSQGGQYVEFRPAVYPGGRVGERGSSSGGSSRRSRR
ncbi:hypothetical protein D6D19_00811 [Aureobasidium pullulans]|uniref:Uncharacterized protein n=1 Tax=Aureobasidium pullulans TaxID=5580 RepID=A0A4V4JW37_AURPU|nr:hypothetical protein D6D19_00811 [Aureobasidium pullulans]THY27863.1 hypothetical protein D6D00_04527 [Aureobasidium pullulans]